MARSYPSGSGTTPAMHLTGSRYAWLGCANGCPNALAIHARGGLGSSARPKETQMATRLRRSLTFANVCSFIALTVALGTGSAYAANTVFSTDIVDGQVKTADLGAQAVVNSKLAPASVSSPSWSTARSPTPTSPPVRSTAPACSTTR
jgi:hypothetical protein